MQVRLDNIRANEITIRSRRRCSSGRAGALACGFGAPRIRRFPAQRPALTECASYLWMLAAGVCGFSLLPKVRVAA